MGADVMVTSWVGRGSRLVLVGFVASTLAAVPHLPAGAKVEEPVRILLLGDSVTQGSAGDWTWRYRLWQHLQDAGVAVDFVGPRADLFDNVGGAFGSGEYVDTHFDRDHAARWGMAVGAPDQPIAELIETYHPDVVVEMLGVIDLLTTDQSPQAVAAAVGDTVSAMRSVDPGIAVVLAEATQHWWPDVTAFNAELDGVAAGLSDVASPVVVAQTATDYESARDTWDTSHPNARGEARIAAAVADALATLGVGSPAVRPLAMPPLGPRSAPTLTVTRQARSATLAWSGPPGATRHLLWTRDVALREPWSLAASDLAASGSRTVTGLSDGHTYAWRLQPAKGDDAPEGDVFSPVGTVSLLRSPRDLRAVDRGRRCVRVRWSPAAGAGSYLLQRRTATGWTRGTRTSATTVTLTRLPRHRSWRLRVRALLGPTSSAATEIVVRRGSGRC